jgi:hypothetical protein
MLPGLMDYKNSLFKKLLNEDKPDPGTLSFLEPGWWALHAAAITTLYLIAHRSGKRS